MSEDQVADAIAEALLRAEKCRRALTEAPTLAEHLRTVVLHSDGRTEAGVAVRPERTPLLTTTADAADELFVVLLEWVDYWSEQLAIKPPMIAVAAWRTSGGIRREGPDVTAGFRATTTPEMASSLVWGLAFWLLVNDDEICAHPKAAIYQDEVTRLVWAQRAGSRLTSAPARTTSPRPCPVCGEQTVYGEFFGSSFEAAARRGDDLLDAVAGVDVRCQTCRWSTKASATLMAKWLVGDKTKPNPYMPTAADDPYYSVKAAAARVKRSTRTIESWIADGMQTVLVDGVHQIEVGVLFETLRTKLQAAKNRPRRADPRL
jgi:hypothetical protein